MQDLLVAARHYVLLDLGAEQNVRVVELGLRQQLDLGAPQTNRV